jgi:hypothetical protein
VRLRCCVVTLESLGELRLVRIGDDDPFARRALGVAPAKKEVEPTREVLEQFDIQVVAGLPLVSRKPPSRALSCGVSARKAPLPVRSSAR